jgi:signal transduction histidine kinase
MFSKALRTPLNTAAWRLSIWTTLAFSIGTALAFLTIYIVVENSVRQRTDAWLSGEAAVLSNVSMNTPQDSLYGRILEEVAELATREIVGDDDGKGQNLKSVFFVQTMDNQPVLWIGPEPKEVFLDAIGRAHLMPGVPQSIYVNNSATPFRVVASGREHGGIIYLGLVDHAAIELLDRLTNRFLMVWIAMVALGFVIAYMSAHRMLSRIERISETVARIGTDDLGKRLPESERSDEISRLSSTFNHMLDRIQASVNQVRTVTDAVAHDLKSPVTWIRGRLEVALSNSDDSSWREPVAEAIEGLDRMAQLLNTTLDLAEAAGGALHLDRTRMDMSALVRQLADLYQPALAEHHHELEIDLAEDIAFDGDISLMNRVVGNLLDNELKHLPDGCRIRIQLTSVGEFAELRIEDNGPGFSPELRQRAFDRFVKGKQSPGRGLGLAFVDAVVRAHGGEVHISDREGGGAVIALSLPVSTLVQSR